MHHTTVIRRNNYDCSTILLRFSYNTIVIMFTYVYVITMQNLHTVALKLAALSGVRPITNEWN